MRAGKFISTKKNLKSTSETLEVEVLCSLPIIENCGQLKESKRSDFKEKESFLKEFM